MRDRFQAGTVLILCICASLLVPATAHGQGDAVDRGVAYLVSAQNADGSWSAGGRELVDTVEAFKALAAAAASMARTRPFGV